MQSQKDPHTFDFRRSFLEERLHSCEMLMDDVKCMHSCTDKMAQAADKTCGNGLGYERENGSSRC